MNHKSGFLRQLAVAPSRKTIKSSQAESRPRASEQALSMPPRLARCNRRDKKKRIRRSAKRSRAGWPVTGQQQVGAPSCTRPPNSSDDARMSTRPPTTRMESVRRTAPAEIQVRYALANNSRANNSPYFQPQNKRPPTRVALACVCACAMARSLSAARAGRPAGRASNWLARSEAVSKSSSRPFAAARECSRPDRDGRTTSRRLS